MSAASAASKLFVPPYPRRPDRPRGSLSTFLAIQRNPIELWCKADFERPVSIGRTIFGLRGAAHDPAAVRRIFLDNAANYRKDDLQLRILRPGLGNGLLTARGRGLALPAPRARALVLSASGRGIRSGRPPGRAGGGRAHGPPPRRRGGGHRPGHVAHDAGSARADAVLARARAGAERLSARGDELFRDHRQGRSARSAGRARVPAAAETPARPRRARIFRFGRRCDHRKATGAARPRGRGAARSPDPAHVGEGP